MYQEVVIWETAEEASLRVIQTIREAEATVKELGAIPIFCTVAPMNLKTWNSKRLQQHKTTHLKHSQHYFGPSQDNPHYTYNMQITLENAVTHINQNIYSINHHNGMYTPKIAEFIFKSPQANRAPVWDTINSWMVCTRIPWSLCAGLRRSWVPSSTTDTIIQNRSILSSQLLYLITSSP